MGSEEQRRFRGRRREPERKTDIPFLPFPTDSKLSIKNIAYLAVYCRLTPHNIAARFRGVGLSDVHLGLAHYYLNPDPIDAELKREMEFNRRDTLGEASMSLPRVGLASLVEALNE